MAKGLIKKVAQRLIAGRYRSHGTNRCHRFSTSHEQKSLVEHETPNTGLVWMKAHSSSYFKEPVEALADVDHLKDDEDIKKELLSTAMDENSKILNRSTMMDTHALVKLMMEAGFTLSQAEAVTMTMARIVNDCSDSLSSSMVSKPQAELTLQKVASQLAILRRDMMLMEKNDFAELITKIERITYELRQLQHSMRDDMNKISSDLTLDLNLEKAKVKDMHLDHLKIVEEKYAKTFSRINELEKQIQNVYSYIDKENASLQTTFERYKSDTVKLAFGTVATCMTIVLGFYRLWS